MAVQSTEIRKFTGIYAQANSFDVPDGALEVCSNVEIQSDGILNKTHGWYKYYTTSLGSAPRGLVTYQDQLLAFGGNGVYFDPNLELSTDPTYSTQLTGVQIPSAFFTPLTIFRTMQQNKNLYYTSISGVLKIEAYNTKQRFAGTPPALDLRATAGYGVVGPLLPNSQTSYRLVFGRRDTNLNLLLSSPSDISTIGLSAGATGRAYTSTGAGPYTITVTTLVAHGLRIGDVIIVTNASDTDANGTVTITAVPTSLTFQYSVAANPTSGTLDYTFTRTGIIEFSIPSEIDDVADEWFYQLYRTTSSASVSVSPSPDFALITEVALTALNISNRWVIFTDDIDPIVVGAQLYTNPNSREGELQANARPPLTRDMIIYKNYALYANTITKQRLFSTLVNPLGITDTSETIFEYSGTTETYVARQGIVANQSVTGTATGVTTVVITYAFHGASNGWVVQIESVTGTVPEGNYTIFAVAANTFSITSTGNTASAVIFSFKTDGANPIFYSDSGSTSLAVRIANTAYYLVKAINRNSSLMYANYVSGFDDAPGNMRFEMKSFDSSNLSLYMRMNIVNPQAYLPPVPTSFSTGQQVASANDIFPDGIFISKYAEPEAVPVVNFLRVGVPNKAIKRIFALRDAVIVLKEDGIYKITGDVITQFSVTLIDSTVLCFSEGGADKVNNTVMTISNQGIVSITDSSVQIVSRRIDDYIQPITGFRLANDNNDYFAAFGYEEGRTWYLCQQTAIAGVPAVTYMFNVLNQSWFTTNELFYCMGLGPDRTIYLGSLDQDTPIKRQRKSFTLIDYSNEFAVGVGYATAAKTAYATMVSGNVFTPAAGDVLVSSGYINRITAVVVNGGGYNLTFEYDTVMTTTPSVAVQWYQGFQSDIKFSPFHAGEVGREKMFSQFQIHLRQETLTNLRLSFSTAGYTPIGTAEWSILNVSPTQGLDTLGWGNDPWGGFPWGQASSQGVTLDIGTQPAIIVRTLVPITSARSTFIQAILGNRQACEPLSIQSISYMVRGYNERVTK